MAIMQGHKSADDDSATKEHTCHNMYWEFNNDKTNCYCIGSHASMFSQEPGMILQHNALLNTFIYGPLSAHSAFKTIRDQIQG